MTILGTLNLQINKKTDDTFYPVTSNVEENVGTTFSLICELVSSINDSQFDDHLLWIRSDRNFHKWQQTNSDIKEINKSVKKFEPLHPGDKGKYTCVSDKFQLVKEVEVLVRNEVRREPKLNRKTVYCSEHMFQVKDSLKLLVCSYF